MMFPNIEAEREKAGMTKGKLAAALGVSANTLRNWQSGKAEIPANKIFSLAKLFHVSADYLLETAGEKQESEDGAKADNVERTDAAEMIQAEQELKHLHVDVSALENSMQPQSSCCRPEILERYEKLSETARQKLLDYAEILLLRQENGGGGTNAK